MLFFFKVILNLKIIPTFSMSQTDWMKSNIVSRTQSVTIPGILQSPQEFRNYQKNCSLVQTPYLQMKLSKQDIPMDGALWNAQYVLISDVTGLGRTRQKPDLDYFFQTETRTQLLRRNPEKPEPDCETRQNPKGFCKD